MEIKARIEIRHGLRANLPTTGKPFEPFFCTDTGELFVWDGTQMAPISATGGSGSKWYVGTGAPSTLHSNGDLYLNGTNGDVYQQAAGAWGSPVANIKGPQGAQGPAGADGSGGGTPAGSNVCVLPGIMNASNSGYPGKSLVYAVYRSGIMNTCASFKIAFRMSYGTFSTRGFKVNKAVAQRYLNNGDGSAIYVDSTPITWGGSASPTFNHGTDGSGQPLQSFLSDEIAVAVDAAHDLYIVIYVDPTSTDSSVSQDFASATNPISWLGCEVQSGDSTGNTSGFSISTLSGSIVPWIGIERIVTA